MAHATTVARRFIAAQLAPGGAVAPSLASLGVAGVHRGRIPPNAPWVVNGAERPRVVFLGQSPGSDLYIVGQRRYTTDPLYQVCAVGRIADVEAGLDDLVDFLDAVALAIDALLHETDGPVAGGYVDACTREAPLDVGPFYGPGTYATYKLGGLYRLVVREE